MGDDIRLSPQTTKVLSALLLTAAEWRYGYDLSCETGLKSGTLYPILVRLAERKWLETRWVHAEDSGKPRHMYRFTAVGRRLARASLEKSGSRVPAMKPAYVRR